MSVTKTVISRRKNYGLPIILGVLSAATGALKLWGPTPPPKADARKGAGPTADEILAAAAPKVSFEEAAAKLGVGADQVRSLVASGRLIAVGGNNVRVDSLLSLVAERLRQSDLDRERAQAREAAVAQVYAEGQPKKRAGAGAAAGGG